MSGFNASDLTIEEMQNMIKLHQVCKGLGMDSKNKGKELCIKTKVGIWKFNIGENVMQHKNLKYLKHHPESGFHQHYKKFQTDEERIRWVYKHDKKITPV